MGHGSRPVTDTAMAADQGISELDDKPDYASLKSPIVSACRDNDADYVDPSDMACAANIATSPPRAWIDETRVAVGFYRRQSGNLKTKPHS